MLFAAAAQKALLLTLALLGSSTAVPDASVADVQALKTQVVASEAFQTKVQQTCQRAPATDQTLCASKAENALFCQLLQRSQSEAAQQAVAVACAASAPARQQAPALLEVRMHRHVAAGKAPEDELAKEMTHDLEMNFNKIAPFGKEDTAKELQDHAAKTQDTLVDAVENAEVAEIKRAVFRALTRLRAATIKEFDTIARLETQAIDAYNDAHHYRAENPLAHLHEDEAPVETDKLKSFH